MLISCPNYTIENFDPEQFKPLVKGTVRQIRKLRRIYPQIEALAACGHSGLMLMGAVSYVTGLPQIAVRKAQDTKHDDRLVNGTVEAKGYVILDDLIDSGKTLRHIIHEIDREASRYNNKPNGRRPNPVAVFLYDGCDELRVWMCKNVPCRDNFRMPVYTPDTPITKKGAGRIDRIEPGWAWQRRSKK